jgi:dephospho-CoA kinase
MVVIGLVGKIAAGKSTVAQAFADRGVEVIDADRLAHAALADPEAVARIVARFGADVLDGAGRVRRPVLAERVFGPTAGHDAALRDLEAIVHPLVRRRIEARLAEIGATERGGRGTPVVLDVPLLMQAGWDRLCDRIVAVQCDEAVRQRRLEARGWPTAQRAARERAWERHYRPPPAEKTVVVDASAELAYTAAQVARILKSIDASRG